MMFNLCTSFNPFKFHGQSRTRTIETNSGMLINWQIIVFYAMNILYNMKDSFLIKANKIIRQLNTNATPLLQCSQLAIYNHF
jgi:hypothetical protein